MLNSCGQQFITNSIYISSGVYLKLVTTVPHLVYDGVLAAEELVSLCLDKLPVSEELIEVFAEGVDALPPYQLGQIRMLAFLTDH